MGATACITLGDKGPFTRLIGASRQHLGNNYAHVPRSASGSHPSRKISATGSLFLVFQAEDGIRGYKVTGVQTCALPISAAQHGAVQRDPARPPARDRARCAA